MKETELLKQSIIDAKEMIAELEAGKSVSINKFLPVYNRITGKREESNCPGCWKPRVAFLKKKIEILEKEIVGGTPKPLPMDKKKEEAPKKKRGRPRKK